MAVILRLRLRPGHLLFGHAHHDSTAFDGRLDFRRESLYFYPRVGRYYELAEVVLLAEMFGEFVLQYEIFFITRYHKLVRVCRLHSSCVSVNSLVRRHLNGRPRLQVGAKLHPVGVTRSINTSVVIKSHCTAPEAVR
jgi:hypothetical protein